MNIYGQNGNINSLLGKAEKEQKALFIISSIRDIFEQKGGGHDVRIRGRNSDLAGGVKFCT